MSDIIDELQKKKQRLRELKELQIKAHCSVEHSSGENVKREMEIEDLEDEVFDLEKKASESL
ncbi:hypothetical protein ACFL5V_08520 [Fibrobacterota bacterium]